MKEINHYVIQEYPHRCWESVEVLKNGQHIAKVNKFYDVTPEWIIIYDTDGGSGIGFTKGNVVQKIYIGDGDLTVNKIDQDTPPINTERYFGGIDPYDVKKSIVNAFDNMITPEKVFPKQEPPLWDGWVSVKDRLPDSEANPILVSVDNKISSPYTSCAVWNDKRFLWVGTHNEISCVTHWAELPKHPNQ